MNRRLFWVILLMSVAILPAFSQEKSANDYDGSKHISGTDYSAYRKHRHGESTEVRPEANVIKFSLMAWINGNIPVYYERRVTPWLGLQVGAGLTTRDFIGDVVTDVVNLYRFNNPPADYNNYAYYAREGRKSTLGFYVSFQPKFYPSSKALAGFFVSPMVEFKRYDFKAQYADLYSTSSYDDGPTFASQTMGEYKNAVDFTVNVGRQWLLSSRVSLELMGGVGFRKVWEQRRYIDVQQGVYNPITGSTSGDTYTTTTQLSTYFRPEFNFAFLIGGFF